MSISKFGHHINVKNNDKITVTEDIDVKNYKISNVKFPDKDSDAVNKKYVDNYLKDFYKGVSDSLQSIINSTNTEYDLIKKRIENLKNQTNLNNKSNKGLDSNFKSLKQQLVKLEKDFKSNVIKIQKDTKDLVNKSVDSIKIDFMQIKQQFVILEKDFKNNVIKIQKNIIDLTNKTNNIQNDVTQFKKHQDDIFIKKEKDLNDIFDKIFNSILDNVHRIDNLEKNLKKTEKLLDKQTINTALNSSFFKAKTDEFETKSEDFKVQLNEFRKAVKYYDTQMASNNASYYVKFNNMEKRIENLEKSIP